MSEEQKATVTKPDKPKKSKLSKLEIRWIIYDVGNSAFTLVASSLFAIFFQLMVDNSLAGTMDPTAIQSYGDAVYGYAATAVTLASVILEPLFGTISDYKGTRKILFLALSLLGIIGCMALGVPMQYVVWLVILCVTKVVYNGALMVYDSMLVDVTTPAHVDKVSSFGYAFGYIGSCIPFLIGVAIVALGFTTYGNYQPSSFMDGISHSLTVPWGYLICFIINALWWLGFTLPLFFSYKQIYGIERNKENAWHKEIAGAYSRLFHTIKDARKNPGILLFLLAFFFYIDGVYSVIDLAMKIAPSLGVDNVSALGALIMVQFIAFPATALTAKLSKVIRNDYLIGMGIIGYLFVTVWAVFIQAPNAYNGQAESAWMFWVLAACVGIFQGGIQSMSRSYLTKIIDKNDSGEFFSIFDTFGKGASFVGTLLYSVIRNATANSADPWIAAFSPNLSIIPLSCLVALGGIIFIFAAKVNAPKLKAHQDAVNKEAGNP